MGLSAESYITISQEIKYNPMKQSCYDVCDTPYRLNFYQRMSKVLKGEEMMTIPVSCNTENSCSFTSKKAEIYKDNPGKKIHYFIGIVLFIVIIVFIVNFFLSRPREVDNPLEVSLSTPSDPLYYIQEV